VGPRTPQLVTANDFGEQQDEQQGGVDDGCSEGEEIVILLGDELPDFVNKKPKSDARQHRADYRCPSVLHHQGHGAGEEQRQSAPERMGEVERRATDLRIAGEHEEQAGHGNGQRAAHQNDHHQPGRTIRDDDEWVRGGSRIGACRSGVLCRRFGGSHHVLL
jgi:hypothetical protein